MLEVKESKKTETSNEVNEAVTTTTTNHVDGVSTGGDNVAVNCSSSKTSSSPLPGTKKYPVINKKTSDGVTNGPTAAAKDVNHESGDKSKKLSKKGDSVSKSSSVVKSQVATKEDVENDTFVVDEEMKKKYVEYQKLVEAGFTNRIIIERLCQLFYMGDDDADGGDENEGDKSDEKEGAKDGNNKKTINVAPKVTLSDLDDRAIDALKDYGKSKIDTDTLLAILDEFESSDLEHVTNKSAFLCGLMKAQRQKMKSPIHCPSCPSTTPTPDSKSSGIGKKGKTSTSGAGDSVAVVNGQASGPMKGPHSVHHPGPDPVKLKEILDRTSYSLDVTSGQRKYGGPPPTEEAGGGAEDGAGKDGSDEDGNQCPGAGCEVFVGKIPKDVFEDKLIPLFESIGKIWDLRLMIDPLTGYNRGYAFITYCNREDAAIASEKFDGYEIEEGKKLKVNISVPNVRLFVGNIPKSKSKEDIFNEFAKITAGLAEVIVYSSPDDRKKNRGFCFLQYECHKSASLAKRKLTSGRVTKVWGCDILVDWADPQEEPDEDTMDKVKVLYVRNLTTDVSEDEIKDLFEKYAVDGHDGHDKDGDADDEDGDKMCKDAEKLEVPSSSESDSKPAAQSNEKEVPETEDEKSEEDDLKDGPKDKDEAIDESKSKGGNNKKAPTSVSTSVVVKESGGGNNNTDGIVERVKKIKDYAFVHFEHREHAIRAMERLDGYNFHGVTISVSLAKPPSDKKKKEEILRARERRVNQMMASRHGDVLGVHMPGGPAMIPLAALGHHHLAPHLVPHLGLHPAHHLTAPHHLLGHHPHHHLQPPPLAPQLMAHHHHHHASPFAQPPSSALNPGHHHHHHNHHQNHGNNARSGSSKNNNHNNHNNRGSNASSSSASSLSNNSGTNHHHHGHNHGRSNNINSTTNPYASYGSPYLDWYSYYSQAGAALAMSVPPPAGAIPGSPAIAAPWPWAATPGAPTTSSFIRPTGHPPHQHQQHNVAAMYPPPLNHHQHHHQQQQHNPSHGLQHQLNPGAAAVNYGHHQHHPAGGGGGRRLWTPSSNSNNNNNGNQLASNVPNGGSAASTSHQNRRRSNNNNNSSNNR